jgi:hypothetical protein
MVRVCDWIRVIMDENRNRDSNIAIWCILGEPLREIFANI